MNPGNNIATKLVMEIVLVTKIWLVMVVFTVAILLEHWCPTILMAHMVMETTVPECRLIGDGMMLHSSLNGW